MLIFDEVVTGFRLAWGGGMEHYGVTPDLCTLGKIIGGGFPLAAIVGGDIMQHFDKALVGPEEFTFQVGTLSGNPMAAVASSRRLRSCRVTMPMRRSFPWQAADGSSINHLVMPGCPPHRR